MVDRRRRRHSRNPSAEDARAAGEPTPLLDILDTIDEATQLGTAVKTSAAAAVQAFRGGRKAARLVKRLRRRKQSLP